MKYQIQLFLNSGVQRACERGALLIFEWRCWKLAIPWMHKPRGAPLLQNQSAYSWEGETFPFLLHVVSDWSTFQACAPVSLAVCCLTLSKGRDQGHL